MQVRDGNPGGQNGVVRVLSGHRRGRFGRQVIEFGGCNPVVQTAHHFHRHIDGLKVSRVETVAQFLDAGGDFVELD